MKTTDVLSQADLRPYQQKLVTHLYEHDGTLARLPMGAGKTVCTLTAIKELLRDGVLTRVLVVAPLRVATLVWQQDAARWTHLQCLDIVIACGPVAKRVKAVLTESADIVTINVENLPWLVENGYLDRFDGIVFDEITKFKHPTGKRLKAVEKQVSEIPWRVGLTGSIRPQHVQDVFAPMKLVTNERPLGKNITAFRKKYCVQDPYVRGRYLTLPGSEPLVAKVMAPWVYQIADSEYTAQLPELNIVRIPVEMPASAISIYKKMKFEYAAEGVEAASVASATLKLQQITSGFMYSNEEDTLQIHKAKIDALKDILDDCDENVLIAYWFKEDLAMIQDAIGCEYIGAGVSASAADALVAKWNRGELEQLAVHPASVGHGLNMQDGGHTIIWFTGVYSFELHEQLIARLRRSGQSNDSVTSIHMIAAEIDDVVLRTALGKGELQDNFVKYLKDGE